MNLRSDPRFEAYVEDAVATVRGRFPRRDLKGDSILPLLLIGIAGLSVANTILTWGTAEVLALQISGAAGLATLASLCWLSEPRVEPVRLHAVESSRSPSRRRSLE
jgi:hypothetical protein